jgi:hypothetical protein
MQRIVSPPWAPGPLFWGKLSTVRQFGSVTYSRLIFTAAKVRTCIGLRGKGARR